MMKGRSVSVRSESYRVGFRIEILTITPVGSHSSMRLLSASSGLIRDRCERFCLYFLCCGCRRFSTSHRVLAQHTLPGPSRSWLLHGACPTIRARYLPGTTCFLPRSALRRCFVILKWERVAGWLSRDFALGCPPWRRSPRLILLPAYCCSSSFASRA